MDKFILLFRTRLAIHIVGAIASCEIAMTILVHFLPIKYAIFYASITALLMATISEIRDIWKWDESWIKEWYDFAGWGFGGCVFIALELLKL